jgi:hypothetical protein
MSLSTVYRWRRSGAPAVAVMNPTPCRLAADRGCREPDRRSGRTAPCGPAFIVSPPAFDEGGGQLVERLRPPATACRVLGCAAKRTPAVANSPMVNPTGSGMARRSRSSSGVSSVLGGEASRNPGTALYSTVRPWGWPVHASKPGHATTLIPGPPSTVHVPGTPNPAGCAVTKNAAKANTRPPTMRIARVRDRTGALVSTCGL